MGPALARPTLGHLVAFILFSMGWSPPALAQPTPCTRDTVGLDPSMANSSLGTFLGSALGQTFLASDTLLTRITVWRPPNQINAVGTRLFVTIVDTTFSPPRPITTWPSNGIIQDGPTVFIRDGDPGQHIRMDFVLDPPLALPRPRMYAMFFQREGCDIGETRLITAEPGVYAPGTYWDSPRTAGGSCYLRPTNDWLDIDLIFELEFCRDVQTPALRRTWGSVKTIYR